MSITNIETTEKFEVQFNPEKAKLSQSASYTRHNVPTLSFQPLGYEYTTNVKFKAKLLVDGTTEVAIATNFVANIERFLFSLLHPPDDADSLLEAEPPRTLLLWPGWLALRTKLVSIDEEVERFDFAPRDPRPTYVIYDLDFEEARKLDIGSESVRTVGFQRG